MTFMHYNGSRDEPVRLFGGTTCPRMINIFHNEEFIFRNPFNFRDRFHEGEDFLHYNKHMAERYWETNLVPDVNAFPLDDFPMMRLEKSVVSVLNILKKIVATPAGANSPLNHNNE